MFANSPHLRDARTFKRAGNLARRRLQRLRLGADPHGFNHIGRNLALQAARNRFDFREFRHGDSAFPL
jgi:hypothetical protein